MYDHIIVDTVNLAYRVRREGKTQPWRELSKIGNRRVLRPLIREFINEVRYLEKKFLNPDGHITFLFDNYTSREELRASFIPASSYVQRKELNRFYKSNRKEATVEFYASIDLIHYWAKLNGPRYHTARIFKLEADDLLPPCIRLLGADKKILLVTNDSDWAKAMNSNIDMLPELRKDPFTVRKFKNKKGYIPTEEHVALDKMLFGDKADNVVSVFPMFTKEEKEYVLTAYTNVVDLLFDLPNDEKLKHHAIAVKDAERDIKLAYKMLSSIPVDDKHFKAVYTTGRPADGLRQKLEDIICLPDEEQVQIEPSSDFCMVMVPRKAPVANQRPISEYMMAWNNKDEEETTK